MKIKTGNGWPHDVTRADLEISYYKGSGNGGQKKQKTSSGVRIKHIPTGITTTCDEHREQSKNKQLAFRKLADLLVPIMKNEAKKPRYSAPDERIRTYSEHDQRVKDTRISQLYTYDGVIEEDELAEIIEALLVANEDS